MKVQPKKFWQNCHLTSLRGKDGKNEKKKGQRKNNWKWLFIAAAAHLLGVSAYENADYTVGS